MRRGAYEVNAVYGISGIDVNHVDGEYGVRAPAGLGDQAGSGPGGGGAMTNVARDGGAAGVGGCLRDPRGWGAGVRDSVGKLGLGWIWQNVQDTVSRALSRLRWLASCGGTGD